MIVYVTFPKLLNLHGKTLLCYVISMFCGYTVLSIVQFNSDVMPAFCTFFGEFEVFEILFKRSLIFYYNELSQKISKTIQFLILIKNFSILHLFQLPGCLQLAQRSLLRHMALFRVSAFQIPLKKIKNFHSQLIRICHTFGKNHITKSIKTLTNIVFR